MRQQNVAFLIVEKFTVYLKWRIEKTLPLILFSTFIEWLIVSSIVAQNILSQSHCHFQRGLIRAKSPFCVQKRKAFLW